MRFTPPQKPSDCLDQGSPLVSHSSWNSSSIDHTALKLVVPPQPGSSGPRVEAENQFLMKSLNDEWMDESKLTQSPYGKGNLKVLNLNAGLMKMHGGKKHLPWG